MVIYNPLLMATPSGGASFVKTGEIAIRQFVQVRRYLTTTTHNIVETVDVSAT